MDKKIAEKIAKYSEVKAEDIKAEDLLREDLGLDSIFLVELVNDIELGFDIIIDDEDLVSVETAGDVAELVKTKLS